MLRAAIDQVGAVQSVQLVSGPTLLFSAAYNAVRQWHYGETTLNGHSAIESVEEITVVFRLGNTAASSLMTGSRSTGYGFGPPLEQAPRFALRALISFTGQ